MGEKEVKCVSTYAIRTTEVNVQRVNQIFLSTGDVIR